MRTAEEIIGKVAEPMYIKRIGELLKLVREYRYKYHVEKRKVSKLMKEVSK